ncbi:MAG: dihydropteridine reductase [Ruminococcus sp.]|nr:dihydropteridine reductase [Ruminococcus sp.]
MNRNDTEFMVQKIRTQYMEKNSSEKNLDLLRELDAEVKRPANVFGYVFGSISAIIMGAGMSLVMTDIGQQLGISNTMPLGIIIGVVGMLMAITTYPIYKNILASRKEKYADRILELSEKIMNEEK